MSCTAVQLRTMDHRFINCANCHKKFNVDESVSFLESANVDQVSVGLTVIEIIAEVFGVNEQLESLLANIEDEGNVPCLCRRCDRLISTCVLLRKEFLTLCHPSATLRPILVDDVDIIDHCDPAEKADKNIKEGEISAESLKTEKRNKECRVLIKPLPFVYESPRLSRHVKIEKGVIQEEDDLSSFCSWNDEGSLHEHDIKLEVDDEEYYDDELVRTPGPQSEVPCVVKEPNEDKRVKTPVNSKAATNVAQPRKKEETLSPDRLLRARNKCRLCPKVFALASQLGEHEQTHNDTGNETDDCVSELQSDDDDNAMIPSDEDSESDPDDVIDEMSMTISDTEKEPPMKKSKLAKDNIPSIKQNAKCERKLDGVMFGCDVDGCIKCFAFKARLLTHIAVDHKPNDPAVDGTDFRCSLCDFKTDNSDTLMLHFFSHTKEEPYQCNFDNCKFKTFHFKEFRGHCHSLNNGNRSRTSDPLNHRYQRIKGDKTEFKCLQCTATFAFKAQLCSHEVTRHSSEDGQSQTHKCKEPDCDFTSAVKYNFKEHMFRVHTLENRFECTWKKCTFASIGQVDIRNHVLTHLRERKMYKNPLQCEVCDTVFTSKSRYMTHMHRIHILSFECNFCGKLFGRPEKLTFHLHNDHEGYDYDPYRRNVGNCNQASDPILRCYQRINGDNTQFKCLKCSDTFTFKAQLLSHDITRHFSEDGQFGQSSTKSTYKCTEPNCDFTSTFQYDFTDHMFRKHTCENRFKCLWEECTFASVDQVDIRKHVLTHFREQNPAKNPLQCVICDKLSAAQVYFKRHMNKHHIFPYECHLCGRLSSTIESSIYHLRKDHKDYVPIVDVENKFKITYGGSFSCDVTGCAKVYPFKAKLFAHSVIDHSPGDQNESDSLTCHLCKTKLAGGPLLEQHYFEMHTKEKLFKCPSCDFSSTYFPALQIHMRSGYRCHERKLLPAESMKFQCTICEKWFARKMKLRDHLAIHSNDRPYSCEVCSKTFKTDKSLRLHCRDSHNLKISICNYPKPPAITEDMNGTIEKIPPKNSFPCKEKDCEKLFDFEALLLTHVHIDHVLRSKGITDFTCGLCEFKTTQMTYLKQHYHRHTKEMAFKCSSCDFSAVTAIQITQHLKSGIHSNSKSKPNTPKSKPLKCTVMCQFCGKLLSGPKSLDNHVKKKHSDE